MKQQQFFRSRPTDLPGSRARLARINKELEAGFRFMEKFDEIPAVTVYGSSRATPGEEHYDRAQELSRQLARRNIAVVTGGGPGIMEAANKGCFETNGISIGLLIELDHLKEDPNLYMTDHITFYYFFARKMILAHIAQAYVYFPGGFGTMDEFFKLATLMATKKIANMPRVVLMGSDYWNGLFCWLRECAGGKKYHALSHESLDNFCVTDRIDEAVEILTQTPTSIETSDSL